MPADFHPLGNRSSLSYNANGQQISVEDANGHRTTTLFDSASRPIAEINALGNRTTTMYDAVGNTTALIDARGNRHSFLYDADDRETALIDPLSRRTTTGYDAAGNQTLRIDARNNRTTYTFDATAQLTARRYPAASRVTFTWDDDEVLNRFRFGDLVLAFERNGFALEAGEKFNWMYFAWELLPMAFRPLEVFTPIFIGLETLLHPLLKTWGGHCWMIGRKPGPKLFSESAWRGRA